MPKPRSNSWSVGQCSETGYVRGENQDRMGWVRAPAADVFVVADGMGGHANGALAAQLTVQTLQENLSGMTSLDDAAGILGRALQVANDVVYARGHKGHAGAAGMGATVVALLAARARIMLAHVGDSRAYLFTRAGSLRRLTKDHSRVQAMVDAGVLTEAQAAVHPDASLLERAIGHATRVEVEVSGWIKVRPGDVCMLCSDGLCGYVGDAEIADTMRERRPPQAVAERLVHLALERGGEDNVTVQVVRYGRAGMFRGPLMVRHNRTRAGLCVAAALAAAASLGWFGARGQWFQNDAAKVVPSAVSTASPPQLGYASAAAVARPGGIPLSVPERIAALEQELKQERERRDDQAKALNERLAKLEARVFPPPKAPPASNADKTRNKRGKDSKSSGPKQGMDKPQAPTGTPAATDTPKQAIPAAHDEAGAVSPARSER